MQSAKHFLYENQNLCYTSIHGRIERARVWDGSHRGRREEKIFLFESPVTHWKVTIRKNKRK